MKDCTSFGDFNINEYNSKNTQSSNNNNEIYKNSLKISKLHEFKNKQEYSGFYQQIFNIALPTRLLRIVRTQNCIPWKT